MFFLFIKKNLKPTCIIISHNSMSFRIRSPRILFLVGNDQCSDDCDNPEHPPTILCDFINSNSSGIQLGECRRTFRKINLLLRQEHSLIFPPNLWMGYLTKDWAHVCELWCVQSLLQHLLLTEQMICCSTLCIDFPNKWFFRKKRKKTKQFPLKINENEIFKNQKKVSIENTNKCQGWNFFRIFLIFRKSL